jgi:hypothetical protein
LSPAVGRAGQAQIFWVGAERPVLGLLDDCLNPSEQSAYTNNIGSQGIRLAAEVRGIQEAVESP